jgi:hypothetical protein
MWPERCSSIFRSTTGLRRIRSSSPQKVKLTRPNHLKIGGPSGEKAIRGIFSSFLLFRVRSASSSRESGVPSIDFVPRSPRMLPSMGQPFSVPRTNWDVSSFHAPRRAPTRERPQYFACKMACCTLQPWGPLLGSGRGSSDRLRPEHRTAAQQADEAAHHPSSPSARAGAGSLSSSRWVKSFRFSSVTPWMTRTSTLLSPPSATGDPVLRRVACEILGPAKTADLDLAGGTLGFDVVLGQSPQKVASAAVGQDTVTLAMNAGDSGSERFRVSASAPGPRRGQDHDVDARGQDSKRQSACFSCASEPWSPQELARGSRHRDRRRRHHPRWHQRSLRLGWRPFSLEVLVALSAMTSMRRVKTAGASTATTTASHKVGSPPLLAVKVTPRQQTPRWRTRWRARGWPPPSAPGTRWRWPSPKAAWSLRIRRDCRPRAGHDGLLVGGEKSRPACVSPGQDHGPRRCSLGGRWRGSRVR